MSSTTRSNGCRRRGIPAHCGHRARRRHVVTVGAQRVRPSRRAGPRRPRRRAPARPARRRLRVSWPSRGRRKHVESPTIGPSARAIPTRTPMNLADERQPPVGSRLSAAGRASAQSHEPPQRAPPPHCPPPISAHLAACPARPAPPRASRASRSCCPASTRSDNVADAVARRAGGRAPSPTTTRSSSSTTAAPIARARSPRRSRRRRATCASSRTSTTAATAPRVRSGFAGRADGLDPAHRRRPAVRRRRARRTSRRSPAEARHRRGLPDHRAWTRCTAA